MLDQKPDKHTATITCNASLFATLWALSFLIYQLKHAPWSASLPTELVVVNLLMIVTAGSVIWRPNDGRLFVAMVATQLASVLIQLPGMSNCWMFSGIVGLGIVAGAVRVVRSEKSFTSAFIYEELEPFLRVALIVFYVFAALAKYNYDFIDPETSDAAYIAYMFADSFQLPAWDFIGISAIGGALFFETAIPILLFIPATRRYGVMLGLLFHTVLAHNSLMQIIDFNAMLFAMYVVFLPDEFTRKVWEDAKSRSSWLVSLVRHRMRFLICLFAVSGIVIAWQCFDGSGRVLMHYRTNLWLLIGCTIAVLAFRGLFRGEAFVKANKSLRLRSSAEFAVIGLLLLNGLSPYLGLKTVVSFTMFSDLRTESGYENHLFMPKSLKCFDLQDQPVHILASTVPELSQYSQDGDLLLMYDLQLRAQDFPDQSVTYSVNGEEFVVPRIGDDPVLGRPMSPLAKKLLIFRPIRLNSDQPSW